ncbi:heme uptake protein IsdC [Cohnella sp. 56]|uniref:heme uptake protein IsdC n=1 Tax=Cohnella sp. 56 TaxID=3113722 RepID=UPI0030EAC432
MSRRRLAALSALLVLIVVSVWLRPAVVRAAEALADGTYSIAYTVLRAEDDSASIANDYFEKPAKVTVAGGAITVELRMNHSKWITEFKVPSGGSYIDAAVVASDKAKDTRTVRFAVTDLSAPLAVKMHVTVEDIDYDHDYTVRYAFEPGHAKLLEGTTAGGEPAATQAPAATKTPTGTNTPVKMQQPAETQASAAPQAPAATPTQDKAAASPTPAATAPAKTQQAGGASESGASGAQASAAPQPAASPAAADGELQPSADAGSAADLAPQPSSLPPEETAGAAGVSAAAPAATVAAAASPSPTAASDARNVWIAVGIAVAAALIAGSLVYRSRNRNTR